MVGVPEQIVEPVYVFCVIVVTPFTVVVVSMVESVLYHVVGLVLVRPLLSMHTPNC